MNFRYAIVSLLFLFTTAFADDSIVDMPLEDAHKQNICEKGVCNTTVWVRFKGPETARYYIDINAYRIDEEDTFLTYKLVGKMNAEGYDGDVDAVIHRVRFDCERRLFKRLTYQYLIGTEIVFRSEFKQKPQSVKIGGPLMADLFWRACAAHNLLVTGKSE